MTVTPKKVKDPDDGSEQYIVIAAYIVGNQANGFHSAYRWDGHYYDTRELAIAEGFRYGRSDDFNIGVINVKNSLLKAIDWMNERVETDLTVLADVNEQLGLPRGPRR